MPVAGAETVAKNIALFGGGFLKHVKKVMTKVTQDLDKEVTKNMSLVDHTLRDLAVMGHPYAGRHGSQGLKIHDPYWQVHIQSGELLRSKDSGVTEPNVTGDNLHVSGYVKLNELYATHALHVVWGTSKMIPRDFLSGSLNDEAFQRASKDYLTKNLGDMVLNFKGIETR
jgi:hypothetical protein